MADVRMDPVAVRRLARSVLDAADRIDDSHWATMGFDDMTESAVARAATSPQVQGRIADLVADMRTWASGATSVASEMDAAQMRHVQRLGAGR